jgi:chromosome segregation protein
VLQALELHGFKSFADRTRFEFPPGITVVVGPNGSGKSNVVDAIKWVLGSQSAKAMRGKEMTDVIFGGTRGRKQTNSADVTLGFDNTNGLLDVDATEVQVTRRVYRSGESEYLINRQPCRLRDIRDLFAGTGVAGGAYSIIEQGKVDALLQSSPQQRRMIFEEAAGVSRFKLKRQESARRLERVEQNLLRLSDIVDELGARLRSVRSQAGKAQKYKQQSDRLRELRTQAGLADWCDITNQLSIANGQVANAHSEITTTEQEMAATEAEIKQAELASDQLQQQLHKLTVKSASTRKHIAQNDTTRSSQLARSDELLQESESLQRQLLAIVLRVGNSRQLVTATAEQLEMAEKQHGQKQTQVHIHQDKLKQSKTQLSEIRARIEGWRLEHTEAVRSAAQLDNQIEVLKSQQASAKAACSKCNDQWGAMTKSLDQVTQQWEEAKSALCQLAPVVKESAQALDTSQAKLSTMRRQLAKAQKRLADLQGQLTGSRERANVLQELERRLDGLSAGVKEILKLAKDDPKGPFGNIRGVVADLLHVDVDTAPLVEIALGERANYLVVTDSSRLSSCLTEELVAKERQRSGRTGFLRLDVPVPNSAVERVDLSGVPGIMGRADQFVETAPDLVVLARRLLGRTWFIDTLANALHYSNDIGRGLNFITVAGEVVGPDGTLLIGTHQSTTGLLSRRSELRAIHEEITKLHQQHEQASKQCQDLEASIAAEERTALQLTAEHTHLTEQSNEVRLQTESAQNRRKQCADRLQELANQRDMALHQTESTTSELLHSQNQLNQYRQTLDQLEHLLDSDTQQIADLERRIASLQRTAADERVALARCEQRRDSLLHQMNGLQRDHDERDRVLDETRCRLTSCHDQRDELIHSVLNLTTELAELYRNIDTISSSIHQCHQDDRRIRAAKKKHAIVIDRLRKQLLERQRQFQKHQLDSQQLVYQRTSLAGRLMDDYQIDLEQIAQTESNHATSIDEGTEQEIRQLREQLHQIGSVNLESLSELETLEQRHDSLHEQFQDLSEAKSRLERIIKQINTDSRALFTSTIDEIRGHFQELFRNLFGGGEADIVMDEGENADVLECGIEIIARPPGKQLRNISLLSGGERTLTCVALLLAIFQSRPSPFCILDEVDAALDEANIDRFVEVIKQFMQSTQFIVITHSKRTMVCGDTLYGVTMQESGISKRMSVRMEDVGANGHIRTIRTAA